MKSRIAAACIAAAAPLACVPSVAGPELSAPGAAEVMQAHSSAVKLDTEPELFGWDPSSRANLHRLHLDGVVVVRYVARADGGADLVLLSNCIGKTGRYRFTAHPETVSRVVRNETELRAALPVGSARFSAQLSGNRALRTDYQLVGVVALPAGTRYSRADLVGSECASATHMVSAIYLGGFAVAAGEAREVEASGSVFSASASGAARNSITRVETAGDPEACAAALKSGQPSPLCSAPLRLALSPLDEPPALVALPATPVPPAPAPPAPLPLIPGIPPELQRQGTGVFIGTVTDERTGRPVADVVVTAVVLPATDGPVVVTDGLGQFRIPRLPANGYLLMFRHDDYVPLNNGMLQLLPGVTLRVDTKLRPAKR